MAPSRKSVLVIGLGENPDPTSHINKEWIQNAVQKQVKELDEVGVTFRAYLAGLNNPNTVAEFVEILKEKEYDAVGVGFGVRGGVEFTPLFEELMTAIFREAKGKPKLIFPTTPMDIANTVFRNFPEHKPN